jgi:hypothetical protein
VRPVRLPGRHGRVFAERAVERRRRNGGVQVRRHLGDLAVEHLRVRVLVVDLVVVANLVWLDRSTDLVLVIAERIVRRRTEPAQLRD